jgi:uncharacterized protein (UPF0335 family)
MSEAGHNSIASDRLLSIIERVEHHNEEKKDIQSAIKDIMAEAKGAGFDPKVIREVIKMRAEDRDDREEREAIRDAYLKALGMY